MRPYKFILSGGTGGHIYPAIAIANELKLRPDAEFLFVGAEDKMEMQKYHKQDMLRVYGLGLQRQINLKMQCFLEAHNSLWKSD
jgi:UDP-N-acetylglucosamine--N-acetylmuramyl-(pentapeptide) pyrophosphoryl-undecaprenol N-acetylglucosamine transferase